MKRSFREILCGLSGKARTVLAETVWPEQSLCVCCRKVLRPFDIAIQPDLPDTALCLDCRETLDKELLEKENTVTKLLFTNVLSVFAYDGKARDLVLALKHGTVSAAAEPLVYYAADLAKRELKLPPETVVTWVTMPASRRRERCIDHGKALAEGIAKELGLPCRQLLIRSEGGHTQQGLNAEERKKNVSGRFTTVEGKMPESVLLVDDVLTTGSTMDECGKMLRKAGVEQITAVTVCAVRRMRSADRKGPRA